MSALWAMVAGAAMASAQPAQPAETAADEQPSEQAQLTPAQMFELADRAWRSGDNSLAEKVLLALAENPDRKLHNEARFRLALLYRSMQRETDAAVLLRRILDEEPEAARVRLELAAMLHKMGDSAAALRELRALRSAPLSSRLARFVDRFAANLQAEKPFGVYVEVALAPDTNINRATRLDTLDTVIGEFEIDEEGQERSGVGGAIRAAANWRMPLSRTVQLTSRLTGQANLYFHSKFNDISAEIATGPEFDIGKGRISVNAIVGQSWFGMSPSQRSARLAVGLSHPVGAVSYLQMDGSLARVKNQFNDLQSGWRASGLIRFERALSPRLMVSAHAGGSRFVAKDEAYSTWSWNAGLAAFRDVGRTSLSAMIDYGGVHADERLALLPRARKDRSVRLQLGAVFRQISFRGLSPFARITHERNRSTVELYDYSRTRTELGLSRAF